MFALFHTDGCALKAQSVHAVLARDSAFESCNETFQKAPPSEHMFDSKVFNQWLDSTLVGSPSLNPSYSGA